MKTLIFIALIAIAGGCASQTQGERMVQSYTRTRETLAKAQNQVDMTMVTLTNLRFTPVEGMGKALQQYKDELAELERAAQEAKWQAQSMREETDAHIKAWQEEMANVKDPTIKGSLESRRQAVRSNFQLIRMYADDARKAYQPFVDGNKHILQALSIDLSPAAFDSLSPAVNKVMDDGRVLKIRLAAMQQALDNIANGISPIGR